MWVVTWTFLTVALHGVIAVFVPHIRGAVFEFGYRIPRGFIEVRSSDLNTPPYTYAFDQDPKGFFYSFSKWCNYYRCMKIVELVYRGNVPAEVRRPGVEVGNAIDKFRVNPNAANHAVGFTIHPVQIMERNDVAVRIKVAVYTHNYDCKVRTYVLQRYWNWVYYEHANTEDCENDPAYFSNRWVQHVWSLENPNRNPNLVGTPSALRVRPFSLWPLRRNSAPQQSAPRSPPPPRMDHSVVQGTKHKVLLVTGEVDEYSYTLPDGYDQENVETNPNDKRCTYFKYVKKPGVQNNEDDDICTVLLTYRGRNVELYKVTCADDETPMRDIWGSILLAGEDEDSTGKYVYVIVRMYNTVCQVRKFQTNSAVITHVTSNDCGNDPHYVLTSWAEEKYKKEQRSTT